MEIASELQQSNFASEEAKAIVNVIFTGNWVAYEQQELLKPYDLSMQQYNVLRILRGQNGKPMTVLAIIERMLDRTSNASRLVDKLVEKKWVLRRECPNDRRAVDVLILPEGLALLQQLDEVQHQWSKRFSHMKQDDLVKLNELLDLLRN
ncbi:MarR family winged helix-turn-helix transcriptional regulator [Aquirufa ecclesiirivi]|uniref:MarR family transcriptional regulator n=1 Tax=Aquirufa ecclesiirivi TaxID=2715124 RepID=A0ABT4JDX8_9BACT|nr:MarR family transcriptional regulator [Aquirufa ecclesiirivi]MCZ2472961.1 MarR family transcriptional regulator [Aquirufa ecclesiirivi]MCZ2474471.1 MarR family transcriptional regulator [Aquirufa ecclesiirivi]MDF0694579.1 MarR family transcriptional regulator [Aquirufa ecclesiirivi]